MKIPVLLGSIRDGRFSDRAAAFVVRRLQAAGIEAPLLDAREMEHFAEPATEGKTSFEEEMRDAEGLVIVTPEYNHGYPGALKDVLDTSDETAAGKPVLICGCSSGGLGGARVVEQLRQVVLEVGLVPMKSAIYFSKHKELWNADGSPKDGAYEGRADAAIAELEWFAWALAEGRKKRPMPETE